MQRAAGGGLTVLVGDAERDVDVAVGGARPQAAPRRARVRVLQLQVHRDVPEHHQRLARVLPCRQRGRTERSFCGPH